MLDSAPYTMVPTAVFNDLQMKVNAIYDLLIKKDAPTVGSVHPIGECFLIVFCSLEVGRMLSSGPSFFRSGSDSAS